MRDAEGNHVSIRDYVDRIFAERDKAAEDRARLEKERLDAEREATRLARENLNSELEKLNKLRQEVTSDRGEFVLKDTYLADQKVAEADRNQIKGGLAVIRVLAAMGAGSLALDVLRLAGLLK